MAHSGAPPPSWRWRLALLSLAALLAATPPARAANEVGVTATIRVSPIVVGLEISPSTIRVGQAVTARVTATNLGTETLRSVTLSLRFEPAGLVPKGVTTSRLSQLKGGKSGEASFKLCGAAAGAYVVLAQAELDGATIESPARLLVVTEGRPAKC